MDRDTDDTSDDTTSPPNVDAQPSSKFVFIVQFDGRKRKWIPNQASMSSNDAFLKSLKEFLETNKGLFVEYEDPDLKELVEFEAVDQLPSKSLLKVSEKIVTEGWITKANATIGEDFPYSLDESPPQWGKNCMRIAGAKHPNLVEYCKTVAESIPFCIGFMVNGDNSWATFKKGKGEGQWVGMTAYVKVAKK